MSEKKHNSKIKWSCKKNNCGGEVAAQPPKTPESVAWLGSASSPGVLCLSSVGPLAVPCVGSVCLVLTCSKTIWTNYDKIAETREMFK